MEIAHRTDVGCVRDLNEDSLGVFQAKCGTFVAVVADGMGGHQAGDVASRYTVEIIEKELSRQNLKVPTDDKGNRLLYAVGKANEIIYSMSMKNKQYHGMGTTVLVAAVDEKEVVLAHVGDSRAYILHNGGLYQLTEDHSYVNFLRKHGQITDEEAEKLSIRNMITRAVGTAEEIEVDLVNTPWYRNDILLLCTDGLTTMVSEREIGLVLTSPNLTLDQKAEKLIQLALDAGGKDNVTLILMKHPDSNA